MTTLTLRDGLLDINPFPDGLKNELKYWKRVMQYNPKTHKRDVVGHYEYMWWENEDGSAHVLAGHTHRVLEWLRSHNIEFEFVDKRTPMPEPRFVRAAEGLRPYQREVVLKMLAARGGLMQCPTGYGKSRMAAKIIDAWDPEELKIRGTPISVFACPSKDITKKNYEELLEALPHREVGLVMSGVKKFSDDVQVITLDSLHLLDPSQVGILIADEVHTAASDSRAEELLKFSKAVMYGVSATPSGRFDGKDLVTEGIFGPVVVSKNYKDGVDCGALVPIEVIWINSPEPTVGLTRYRNYKTRDGKIGAGMIGNWKANQMIANIFKTIPQDMQCLVITQFIEQMDNILRFCDDDVRYVHAQTSSDGLSKYQKVKAISTQDRRDIYTQVYNQDIMKIVSTNIYTTGVNFPNLNIVVNAAGGGSDIASAQIPGRASRKTDGKEVAYMIDFWHPWDVDGSRWGPLLANDKQRRKVYNELGFKQTWIDNLSMLSFKPKLS